MTAKKELLSSAVLIDTPIWEEYFLREERVFQQINKLMDASRVCSLDLIIAELVEGAASGEQIKAFLDFVRIFSILDEPSGVWTQAAEWARNLQRRGKRLSLRNAYVAFMAKTHGVLLWTGGPILSSLKKASAPGVKFFFEEEETE